jgi:signal transduction histidine kinase
MKSTNKERLFWWVAVPALAGVLVALAIMQYRWSEQVSAATRAQMQTSLLTSMQGFRQDLAKELGAVCIELRSAADETGTIRPAQMSRQFQHWQQTAAHPALVEQVYLWHGSPSDEGSLLRLDPTREQLESVSWPDALGSLPQTLSASLADHPGLSMIFNHPGMPMPRRHTSRQHMGMTSHMGPGRHGLDPALLFPWFVEQSIPALVYPLRPRPDDAAAPPAVTWIIVQLNPGVLEKEIFPELAQKYFRGTDGLDYHVAVVAAGQGQEHRIYSSDASFGETNIPAFDRELNLFGPPRSRTDSPGAASDPFLSANRPLLMPGTRPAQGDDRRSAPADRLVRLEPLQRSRDEGVWQLVVKHRRGSVEAAVNGLRTRHLIVSFGVLLVLAATVALVMVASQRARRLAALQMNFVAGVSHELRTPLAVISSAAENLAHGVVADQQQLQRYSASILKQSRQLSQLVEQVLLFAATQQKQGHYLLRPIHVGQVIDAALENTAGMAAAAGVTVERHVEPGLPPAAADFAALSQCLQNLITNAIKYGGEGRWMKVSAAARREDSAVREIEITVEDRGIGISPDEIKQIFEPFYRSPAVAGSNVHGTGLGLPLARTVIEAMRGHLTVTSAPGTGSAFTIHLALAAGLHLPDEESAVEGGIPSEPAGYYP